MKWSDVGIILSSAPHGERLYKVDVFTKHNGLVRAFNRSKVCTLSKVDAFHFPRNSISYWRLHSKTNLLSEIFLNKDKLTIIQRIMKTLNKALPQNEPHNKLYNTFEFICERISAADKTTTLFYNAFFEALTLRETGYCITSKLDSLFRSACLDDIVVTDEHLPAIYQSLQVTSHYINVLLGPVNKSCLASRNP